MRRASLALLLLLLGCGEQVILGTEEAAIYACLGYGGVKYITVADVAGEINRRTSYITVLCQDGTKIEHTIQKAPDGLGRPTVK